MSHKRTLILNSDYLPLTTISWKRALCLDFLSQEVREQGITVILYYQDDFILSAGGLLFPIPAVGVMNRYLKKSRIKIPLSKRNIFVRDNYQCQYCSCILNSDNGSIDHVVPRSIFKKTNVLAASTWENMVAACKKCNLQKADRTPEQAKMKLKAQPSKLDQGSYLKALYLNSDTPIEWDVYLDKSRPL